MLKILLLLFTLCTTQFNFTYAQSNISTASSAGNLGAAISYCNLHTQTPLDDAFDFVPVDVTIGTEVIAETAHGLSDGQKVQVLSDTTLPAGLAVDTIYYIVESTSNDFKLSLTPQGAAVDITSQGTGIHTLQLADWYLPTLAELIKVHPDDSSFIWSKDFVFSQKSGIKYIALKPSTGELKAVESSESYAVRCVK